MVDPSRLANSGFSLAGPFEQRVERTPIAHLRTRTGPSRTFRPSDSLVEPETAEPFNGTTRAHLPAPDPTLPLARTLVTPALTLHDTVPEVMRRPGCFRQTHGNAHGEELSGQRACRRPECCTRKKPRCLVRIRVGEERRVVRGDIVEDPTIALVERVDVGCHNSKPETLAVAELAAMHIEGYNASGRSPTRVMASSERHLMVVALQRWSSNAPPTVTTSTSAPPSPVVLRLSESTVTVQLYDSLGSLT